MIIRSLKQSELEWCRKCAEQFFVDSKLPGRLDFHYWVGYWQNLIHLKIGEVFALVNDCEVLGMLGGVKTRCSMTGDLEAYEMFWYVMPEYRGVAGVKILKHFENWALQSECKRVKMVHLESINPKEMKDLYLRMGYETLEHAYTKELKQ